MAPLDRRHRNREVLTLLLEKASVQGYLTTDDLLELSPEVGEDAERLSVIMLALRHRGVDVLDPEASEAPPNELVMLPGLEPLIEPEPVVNDTLSDDTVGMYFKEMSRVPLLKADEEFEIAIRIEDGRKAKRDLLYAPRRKASFERQGLEALVQDGIMAREHIIKANTRLVVSIAKRYMGR